MDTLTREQYAPPRRPRTRRKVTPTADGSALTGQETAILRLLAQGKTYEEAGEVLHFARDTVKWYAKRIYLRLGARNAAHAVHIAHQRGLLGEVNDG